MGGVSGRLAASTGDGMETGAGKPGKAARSIRTAGPLPPNPPPVATQMRTRLRSLDGQRAAASAKTAMRRWRIACHEKAWALQRGAATAAAIVVAWPSGSRHRRSRWREQKDLLEVSWSRSSAHAKLYGFAQPVEMAAEKVESVGGRM